MRFLALAALACLPLQSVAQEPQAGPDEQNQIAQIKVVPVKPAHPRGRKPIAPDKLKLMYELSNVKHASLKRSIPVCSLATYDARITLTIPPVGNQQSCGDCYNWSGCKVCSCAQMLAGVVPANGQFMLAPSYFLDCQNVGGCGGGDEYQVASLIQSGGAPSVAAYGGDGANPGTCKSLTGMALYKVDSLVMVGSQSGVAATQDIKNYIKVYGYVSVAGDASSWDNIGPNSTITGNGTSIDHAIGLVGWDDTHDNGDGSKGAWIMQNNWDTTWGGTCPNSANTSLTGVTGGYAWIAYGADSIGTEAFVAVLAPVNPPTPPTPPVPPTPSASVTITITDTATPANSWTMNLPTGYTATIGPAPTPTNPDVPVFAAYSVTGTLNHKLITDVTQSSKTPNAAALEAQRLKALGLVNEIKAKGVENASLDFMSVITALAAIVDDVATANFVKLATDFDALIAALSASKPVAQPKAMPSKPKARIQTAEPPLAWKF